MRYVLCFLLLFPLFAYAQHIDISSSDTIFCYSTDVTFTAVADSASPHHFRWMVNGDSTGTDSSIFITSTLSDGDTIFCYLTNATFDTVFAISDTIVVTVHAKPYAGTITGGGNVCVGATLALTNTIAGGVWGSKNIYTSVSNGIVTGMQAGWFECPYSVVDTVFYFISNMYCTDTAFHNIRVDPKPVAVIDLVEPWACPFPGLRFSVPSCYSYTYFVPTDSTRYSVQGDLYAVTTNECGTSTNKYYQKVTFYSYVQDTPVIQTLTKDVCEGDQLKLTAPENNFMHHWKASNLNAELLADSSGAYITGRKAGLDTITLQYSNICGKGLRVASVVIKVNAKPDIRPFASMYCIGDEVNVPDSLAVTWSSSDPEIASISASGILKAVAIGKATITYAFSAGCYGTEKIAVDDCRSDVVLFPVPAHNELVVHIKGTEAYDNISIINLRGQILHVQPIAGEYTLVNVADLLTGVYFIRLSGDKDHKELRFFKE